MTVENWPGRGFYRGNKQAMLNDAAKLFSGTIIASPVPMPTPPLEPVKPLDPPHVAATEPGTPQSMGYTGNECRDCGSTRMVIAGHCEVCLDCGSSSGCS